jgi:hypothetical protein
MDMNTRDDMVVIERAPSTTLAEHLQSLLGAEGIAAFLDPYTAEETVSGEMYREFTGIDVMVKKEDAVRARGVIEESHRAGQILKGLDGVPESGPAEDAS